MTVHEEQAATPAIYTLRVDGNEYALLQALVEQEVHCVEWRGACALEAREGLDGETLTHDEAAHLDYAQVLAQMARGLDVETPGSGAEATAAN